MKTIALAGENGDGLFVIVDDEDFDLLSKHRWRIAKGYALTRIQWGKPDVLMHRLILGLKHGDPRQGDHINRDPLDNRRSNLRVLTQAQNQQNRGTRGTGTSQYRGVCWHARDRRWQASAKIGRKNFHIGLFADELEAARAAQAFRFERMPFSVEDAL